MTKVDVTFKLQRPLNGDELRSIARLHSVYGMLALRLHASGEELFIEYDASRLTPKEVRGTVEQYGIPIK